MKIRVLIADAHGMVREGLRAVLERSGAVEVVGETGSLQEAISMLAQLAPSIAIFDVHSGDPHGNEAVQKAVAAGVKVIVLSLRSDRYSVSAALQAGAMGYLLKVGGTEELTLAIRTAHSGALYLTPKIAALMVDQYLRRPNSNINSDAPARVMKSLSSRETGVLRLIAEGMTSKEIGQKLELSAKTIEAYRAQLMEKLNIRTVAGLTKYAIREGLTPLEA